MVVVNVDVDVVCCSVVDIICGVVAVVNSECIAVMAVVSNFPGFEMANLNTRGRMTAKTVKTIKEMPMIFTERRCHHLRRPLFLVTHSLYTWLLCIICSIRNLKLKKRAIVLKRYKSKLFNENSELIFK